MAAIKLFRHVPPVGAPYVLAFVTPGDKSVRVTDTAQVVALADQIHVPREEIDWGGCRDYLPGDAG